MRKLISSFVIASIAYFALPTKSYAWGFIGHTYIGDVTWHYLSDDAQEWLTDKLQRLDEPSLGTLITWADRIRSTPEGRAMAGLHFANVPPTAESFVLTRDCPKEHCVVGAAISASQLMLNNKQAPQVQAEALRVFTHWLTDLHQPLHLGFYADKGGNSIRVSYQGRQTNLHSLWDTLLIREEKLLQDPVQLAQQNPLPPTPADLNLAILQWATDSNLLAREYAYAGIEPNGEVSRAYIERAIPVLQQQLLYSAQRLAYFIEAAAQL